MASPPAKQGHGDGLCGIYCLVNAVSVADSDWDQKETFRLLLMAVERLGMLDVAHITTGFEFYELIEAFNFFAERNRFPMRAVHILDVWDNFGERSGKATLEALIEDGGQAVVLVTEGGESHWILVSDHDGAVLTVLDSWPDSKRKHLGKLSYANQALALVNYPSEIAERA